MRFRKIRSYLSAFSNDELSDRKQERVREELADSEALRREESIYRSIRDCCRELPKDSISNDFNARLLNRIARERFAETRSKAYLPRTSTPRAWGRLVPVLATVATLVIVGISFLALPGGRQQAIPGTNNALGDSYKTVSSVNNPNMRANVGRKVSLPDMIAIVDRADEISNMLTGNSRFTNVNSGVGSNWIAQTNMVRVPFTIHYYRVVPSQRSQQHVSGKQEDRVY